jgi:ABC-type transport system involved in multi-copper enzyme maturation permease subunit
LFTFDAVSGERESGTLRLVFANNVPRAKYLFAKCTGAWLGLVIPITIPILLGLLLVVAMGVPLTTAHWWKLVLFLQLGLLYFTFFITLGVLISALTRRSSVSFLVGLMVWVIFVLIIPRAGVMAAGQMITVPRVAEIEGQRDGFAKDQWAVHYKEMEGFWADAHGNSEIRDDEDEAINDARMWEQMQQQDAKRSAVEQRIQEYESKLLSDLRRRKEVQRRLAFTLARISPVSAFQLGAMQLAGTGVDLKSRYENAMSEFRTDFNDFVKKRKSETNDMGGMMMITIDSEKGMEIGTGRDDVQLDFEGMPVFQAPTLTLREAATPIIADMGILAIGILLSFFGSFLAFVRYDVR